jgi:RecA/RadA recombinase
MSRFHAFSPEDLEELVADLLSAEAGSRFEVFARGRDRGIDLRRRHEDGKLEIVQVKHYERSSFSTLKTAAAGEKTKLDALTEKPDIYRFVTSQNLTVGRKDELVTELTPYVTDPAQILGADELEQLLRDNPPVERQHPKLWLTGSTQLLDMVHADVRERSRGLIADIEAAMPTYVRHSRFAEAQERLHEGRVLIIAGGPGVGKTTLAHMLVADALAAGYEEPVAVSRHTDELRRVLDTDRRQVVLYDDFLGRSALERLDKNADRELTATMRQVLRSENTLFILTTREYILRHAAQLHEELRHGGVEEQRYLLELSHYSLLDRARIFLNHAYRSSLVGQPAARSLVENDAYLRILEHDNYNPRTIAYITGLAGPGRRIEQPDDYLAFALSVLDEPGQLWRHAFRHELAAPERALLLAKASVPGEVLEGDLRRLYDAVAPRVGAEAGREAFEDALHTLDDSLLRSFQDGKKLFIDVRDPSVEDYLREHVSGHPEHARALVESASAFEQVQWLIKRADVDRLDGLDATLLQSAIERTYEAGSVTWHEVYWEDDPEPITTREDRNLPRRLMAVHGFLQRSEELDGLLRPWWLDRLRALLSHLGDGQHNQRSDLLSLVRTVRGSIHNIEGGGAAIADFMTQALHFDGRWSELLMLRELWPELFDDERWKQLKKQCEEWMLAALTDASELRDVEEVDEIVGVAERMGVEVDERLVEEARNIVEEERGSREDRDYTPPERFSGPPAATEQERAQVHEAFVRLAEEKGDDGSDDQDAGDPGK